MTEQLTSRLRDQPISHIFLTLLRKQYGARLDAIVGSTKDAKIKAAAQWEAVLGKYPPSVIEQARARLGLEYPDTPPDHDIFDRLCQRMADDQHAESQRVLAVRDSKAFYQEPTSRAWDSAKSAIDSYRSIKRSSRETAKVALSNMLDVLVEKTPPSGT